MERGFGWHYPPGTPGPYTTQEYATCLNGHTHQILIHHELGAADAVPEECPDCGEEWDADSYEPTDGEEQ